MTSGVKVEGLKELRRALNQIDPELTKELRGDLLDIGKDVAADAQTLVPLGADEGGHARDDIRAGVSGNTAYVAGGKKSRPYYGWLDFGSRTPVSGRPRSVGPWKRSGKGPKGGRFIYKAIARQAKNIERRAVAAFEKAKKSAFR